MQYHFDDTKKSNTDLHLGVTEGKDALNNIEIMKYLSNNPKSKSFEIGRYLAELDPDFSGKFPDTQRYEVVKKKSTAFKRCEDLTSRHFLTAETMQDHTTRYDLSMKGIIALSLLHSYLAVELLKDPRGEMVPDKRFNFLNVMADDAEETAAQVGGVVKRYAELLGASAILYKVQRGISVHEIDFDSVDEKTLANYVCGQVLPSIVFPETIIPALKDIPRSAKIKASQTEELRNDTKGIMRRMLAKIQDAMG